MPPSKTTRQLLLLLQRWTRQQIHAVLETSATPEAKLLTGEVEVLLQTQAPSRRVTPQLTTSQLADQVIGWFDQDYPALLRHIPDPPLVLYVRGKTAVLSQAAVAIVGARRASTVGRRTASDLASGVAQAGVVVISGLALGIDGAAHSAALAADGQSVAVLGSGLGRLHPKRHQRLAHQLVQSGGALITEYADHLPPRPFRFPERNRIVSGLALGVVVVEAGAHSGSLITARLAAEQGRDVFAVPGPVNSPLSAGCHRLIQQGAALITNHAEVLEGLGWVLSSAPRREVSAPLSEVATRVSGLLSGYVQSADELLELSGLPVEQLNQVLVELELAGIVQRQDVGYIRVRSGP